MDDYLCFRYLVGGLCAVCGMLFTGLPIPIIASNFNIYYNYAKTKFLMVSKVMKEMEKENKRGTAIYKNTSRIFCWPSYQSIEIKG